MLIFSIIIIVAIVCYMVGKKRAVNKNNSEIVKQILWAEALIFLGGYYITDKDSYKVIWMMFMGVAAIFTLVDICLLKNKR